jgi:hypothetical protein
MLISLPSALSAATGAASAGVLTGAMLFGPVPAAQAAQAPAPAPRVALGEMQNPADIGRVVPMDWAGRGGDHGGRGERDHGERGERDHHGEKGERDHHGEKGQRDHHGEKGERGWDHGGWGGRGVDHFGFFDPDGWWRWL